MFDLTRFRALYGDRSTVELVDAALEAGIPPGTFIKIAKGETPNPRLSTVIKLQEFMAKRHEETR